MNGTLDQLDTFFGSITGIWSRILSFFLTCWAGFSLGVLAASVHWDPTDHTFRGDFGIDDWYFVPAAWMFQCVATCFHWWGFIHGLLIVAIAVAVFYTEANLCQTLCSLFLMECWYWWFASDGFENMFGSFLNGYGFEWGKWYPFHTLMVILSAVTLWLGWRSWRNNHPA